jgi:outer membrane immunogenic protein
MRRAIIGVSGLAVSALLMAGPLSVAGAADMAVKAPPLLAPVYSWGGCYVGANTGGAWAHKSTIYENVISTTGVVTPVNAPVGSTTADGWAYGGQIGCDYQVNSTLVVGIRGMGDGTTMKGSNQWPPGTLAFTNNYKINAFETVVGKAGLLLTPTIEVFGLAGVAVAEESLTLTSAVTGAVTATGNQTRTGYDVGGGACTMAARNVDVCIEYDHMGFGTKSFQIGAVGTPTIASYGTSIEQSVDKVLVQIDYRFNVGGKN